MKPPSCQGCPLYDKAGPIWGTGSPNARLVILGQNPGPQEIQEGRPFAGPSGRILDRALGDAAISRTQNFVTNVVKCFVPPGVPVPKGAAEHCKPLLDRELESVRNATTILTLGSEAFDEIARPKKFHMLHDRRVSRKEPTYWIRGCPIRVERSGRTFTIVPTLHPAFVARTGFTIAPVMEADIRKAGRFASGEATWREASYNYNPTTKEIDEYIRLILHNGEGGVDIETPESATEEDELSEGGFLPVGLVGLSALRMHALGVAPDQFDLLKPLFDLDERKVRGYASDVMPVLWAYNAGFDFHHLRRPFKLDAVRAADAMMAFHLLRPEMARKDLGTAMSFYTDLPFHKNLMDTDPEGYNAADTYGVLEAGQNMIAEMRLLAEKQTARFSWANQAPEELFWRHMMPIIPIIGEWGYIGAPYDIDKSNAMELKLTLTLNKYEEWWQEHIPHFSWSSPKQLIEMFEMQNIKVPKVKRPNGTWTPSVDDNFLEKLDKSGNQTAKLIRTMRELRKAGDFLGICDNDNRVYCRAKPHGQVGGRIQTVKQNMQQIPEELAGTSPRDCIIAEHPNDVVISADFSQVEFWIYAWYSQCKRALDIKASGEYLYAGFYEDIWNEPFFLPGKPRTKENRDHDRTPAWKLLVAKSWPLGFTYGRGVPDPAAQGLSIDKSAAKRIYTNFHRDYPEFGRLHGVLKFAANRFGYLQTVFGRIRRFPNPDGQYNEIMAFPGQTTAVDCLIRNALIPIGQNLEPMFGPRSHVYFTVHDSLVCNVNCERDGKFSLDKAFEAYAYVKECFETPIPEMDGYVLPAEVKIGSSWGEGQSWEKFSNARIAASTI